VFVPMLMEIAGSSMVIGGSGRVSSGSHRLSPMVMSGIPAIAAMSPGPASLAGTRSRASVSSSSEMRTRCTEPSLRHQATDEPLRRVPAYTRHSANRPRKGEASRLVTCACSGASGSYGGAGTASTIVRISGSRSGESGICPSAGRVSDARPARAEA
jgi:hypothetical protein